MPIWTGSAPHSAFPASNRGSSRRKPRQSSPGRSRAEPRKRSAVRLRCSRSAGGAQEAFICVFAPGWLDHHIFDEYYGDDEKFVFALADAMREEYRAVVEGGFILQIDDPGVARSEERRVGKECRSRW